jgi:hypothetical protein
MIIETTANQFYDVQETGNADLSHVWYGQRVKKTAQGFAPVKQIRTELVRKAGSRQLA